MTGRGELGPRRVLEGFRQAIRDYRARRKLMSSPYYRGRYRDDGLEDRHPHHPPLLRFDTPAGVYVVPSDAPRDLIVQTIARGTLFDEDVIRACLGLIRKGTCVLDVGANLGQMTVQFARAAEESGRVQAFEAEPYVADVLRVNVSLNGLHNVDIIEGAVWSKPGLLLRYPEPDLREFGTYGSYGIDPVATEGRVVPSISVDSLDIRQPISLMKVDIQGADLFCLQGAEATIKEHRMPIVFEYEPLMEKRFGLSLRDYVDLVHRLRYRLSMVVGRGNYLVVPVEDTKSPSADWGL